MIDFIKKIPKAELHIHIEGSLEPELMFRIGQRNNIDIPFSSVEEVKSAYNFSDLQSFLDIYYSGANVLQQEQDFYDMTKAYLNRCYEQNIIHTEIFFDPQTHTHRGVDFEIVFRGIHRALEEAKKEKNISSKIIMCFLRHLSEEDALETLKKANPFKDSIIGVGLDSSEKDNPPEKFKKVFDRAIDEGYLTVSHAGEEGPPEYIWQALDLLKVKRIDHGVRCIEDSKLMDRLVADEVPLTVCPLSNTKLKVFDKMEDHNILELLERGLIVTANSDDPAYFDGYLNENFNSLNKNIDMSREQTIKLVENSFKASFASPQEKQELYDRLNKFLTEN